MTCSCGTPTRDNAYVCDKCLADLTKALAETPWLVDQLEITLTKQRGVDYTTMGGTGAGKEQPLPLNTGAFEAASQLRATLLAWVRHCELNNTRNQSPHTHRPRPEAIPMSAWLLWRVDGLAFDEKGSDAVSDIVRAFDKGKRVVDRPADKLYVGPCTTETQPDYICGRDLYVKPGHPTVTCGACTTTYEVSDRRDHLREAAENHLATATEISHAIPMLSDTGAALNVVRLIGDWVTAGRLHHKGHVTKLGKERPLYQVGEVMILVEQHRANGRIPRVVGKQQS